MSKHQLRIAWATLIGIAMIAPFLTGQKGIQREWLQQLEKQVQDDPAAVLKALESRQGSQQETGPLQRRARLIRGQALLSLDRNADAEKVFKNLLNELTADAESDPLLVSRTALGLGRALSRQSRPFESEAALNLAMRQLPQAAPADIRAQILLEMTRVMIYLGEPVSAADRATEALEWAAAHDLDPIALQARYLLGYAFRNQNDVAAARPHFNQARQEARRMGNLRIEILSMNELGNLLVMEKKLDAAMEIKQDALAKARKAKDAYLISVCQHDIGYALIARKEYPRALAIYRAILRRETALDNPRSINMARINISFIYSEMGRWKAALQMAEKTLDSVRRNKLGELEPEVLTQMIDVLERQGRPDEALKRQQELTDLNEKQFQREMERKVTEIRDRHRLMEQESEIRILRQDKEIRNLQFGRQRFLIFAMIGLLFFLALLATLALIGYRAKRRANRDLESLNQRLDEISRHDTLTGLSNRRDMMEKLALLKARADRNGTPLSMLMIDMDHFKTINDNQGHDLGDRVLQKVAGILKARLRAQDLLARWGGEEFLIALADTDHNGALRAAEQFRAAVEDGGLSSASAAMPVTITVGVAQYQPGEDLQSLITRADDQLYVGKRAGRNRVAG